MLPLKFNIWLEKYEDLYGFPRKDPPKPKIQDEMPIQIFALNRLMEHLAREQVGDLPVLRKFDDQVQWGQTDGALRARLTPNQGISIERLTSDLRGEPLWITKKLYKIKTEEFVGHEDIVAHEIAENVRTIAEEQIDSPTREYKDLFLLTKKIASHVKGHFLNMFSYEEIKKVSENNYNILFSVLGGVGKLVHRGKSPEYTAAGIIDLSYDQQRGTIKEIFSTVDIESKGGSWTLDVPYATAEFTGSQPIEEILHVVLNGIKFV